MISFELSNGRPFGPHVPTTMDDDQYVEYQLDDLAGFPSNVEEEERMFLEAVIESLKDLEIRRREVEEEQSPCVSSDSQESSQKDNLVASSTAEDCVPSKTELKSTLEERCEPLKTESTSTSLNNDHGSAPQHQSPDTTVSSAPPFDTPQSIIDSGSTETSAGSDTPVSVQSSADADMSANTKATVTVVRNPANHIMDGLMRRWDLNFFRNGR